MKPTSLRSRDLSQVLDELATGPYPDYVDDVLARTARAQQRQTWMFPARWLPGSVLQSQPLVAFQPPWRSMAFIAILLALLLAAVAVVASMRPRLPAPYGPAANGLLAWDKGGDIYTGDVGSRQATPIVTGPGTDVDPEWSLDGTRIVFERHLNTAASLLYSVTADGRELRLLTPEPISLAAADVGRAWKRYEFSPDGRFVLASVVEHGIRSVAIVAADGTGAVRVLDVGMDASEPSFRPPDGAEILFVGRGEEVGLYAVDVKTNAVRSIRTIPTGVDVAGASWSPDGTQVAYWTWAPASRTLGLTAQSRVIRADGSGDRRLPYPAGEVWNAHATWSQDGARIFMVRGFTAVFDDVRGYVLPSDGSSAGVEVSPAGMAETACCAAWSWAPDDRFVLGRNAPRSALEQQQVLIDTTSGQARRLPWTTGSDPAWQRLAP